MDNKEIDDVMRVFSRARREYTKIGDQVRAGKCDEAIALAQDAAITFGVRAKANS